jgi:hypothetical protein
MSEYDDLIERLGDTVPATVEQHMESPWAEILEAADAIQAMQARIEFLEDERNAAIGYLVRNVLEPNNASPLDSINSICTQVDHICHTARNSALEEAAKRMDNNASMLNDAADKLLDPEAATSLNARANYYKDAALVIRSLKGE